MKKALSDTNLIERFTEHDLRAKVASDTNIEHAQQLLGHATSEITNRIYRRKTEKVSHLKNNNNSLKYAYISMLETFVSIRLFIKWHSIYSATRKILRVQLNVVSKV